MSKPSSPALLVTPRTLEDDGADLVDEEILHLHAHLSQAPQPPPPVAVHVLPDQQYLEATVLPLLLRGLEALGSTRPPDPLAFLGAYLLSNNPQKDMSGLQGLPSDVNHHNTNNNNTAGEGEEGEGQRKPPSPLLQREDGRKVNPESIPEKAAKYFYGEKEEQDVAVIPKKK